MAGYAGVVALTVVIAYILAYIFYGKKLLEQKVVRADPTRKTPAYEKFDGIDYVPTNKYVLYGHHFASIAGAGPIVGPAIAMAYGWLLPIVWVIFGNIFIGAVHDYLALMASVRHGGVSIMSVSENVMGRKAKYVFLLYVYAALILVIAAFLSVAAKVFAAVSPSAATVAMFYMPLAILLGMLLYRTGLGTVKSTVIALIILIAGIVYSFEYPFYLPTVHFLGFTIDAYHLWILLLAAYSFVASVLPVWYLLQPRDYLNAYLLWSFVIISVVGALGAFTMKFTGPAYTSFAPPIFKGVATPFWPAIPLIIACGALSGFHSVVASGTSSKQLANELDALLVGYGGMLTEGAVSSFAVIIPIALAWQQPDFKDLLHALGKDALIADYQAKGILALGKIERFAYGYGYMVGKVFHSVTTVGKVMANFAAIALASFILTTLDTATRLGRFAWQEMFDWLEEKSRAAYKVIANRYVASLIAVLAGLVLAYPDVVIAGKKVAAYNIIWPAFAGTNQLLAALALLTSALWVYAVLKVRGGVNWLIQVPAWFLWITVTAGLIWWLIFVAPKYPPIQKYGAGSIVAISLAIDFLLIYLYVQGLRMAQKRAEQLPPTGHQK